MRKLYQTEQDLKKAIKDYFKDNEYRTPRHLRTSLKVSPPMLSTWKTSNPTYFNLIKNAQDLILAELEIDLLKISRGNIKPQNGAKTNPVGIIFMLRAYDRERYVPEIHQDTNQDRVPITIDFKNNSKNKLIIDGNVKEIKKG